MRVLLVVWMSVLLAGCDFNLKEELPRAGVVSTGTLVGTTVCSVVGMPVPACAGVVAGISSFFGGAVVDVEQEPESALGLIESLGETAIWATVAFLILSHFITGWIGRKLKDPGRAAERKIQDERLQMQIQSQQETIRELMVQLRDRQPDIRV